MDSIYAQCESGMPKTPSLLAQFKFLRRPGELVASGQTAMDGLDRLEDKSKINSTIRKALCTRARCTHTHALMCRRTDRSSPRDFDAH